MELKIEMKQQLAQLLAKPSRVSQNDVTFLQDLVATYPFYQPLYLLLAKAAAGTAQQQESFTKAVLFNNGNILHQIINQAQTLSIADEVDTCSYPAWQMVSQSDVKKPADILTIDHDAVVEVAEGEPLDDLLVPSELVATAVDDADENEFPGTSELVQEQKNEPFVLPEIENLPPLQSEVIPVCEDTQELIAAPENDEQETFEEINELVIPNDFIANEPLAMQDETPIAVENNQDAKEDKFNIETFAATDFFAFDLSSSITEEPEAKDNIETKPQPVQTPVDQSPVDNVISKYDDDKLPFTFLWWLAKTRKDHEQIFRPFVAPTKGMAPAQHLQQQYVEHIFHLQAPLDLDNEEVKPAAPKNKKESEIIESFIKNDPQIKALPPNQINTENKAKKSAEDGNDLVSETLAQIYIEQMLYHKAIDTYEKLSLKFPEKSRYFADLIQSLEKKI